MSRQVHRSHEFLECASCAPLEKITSGPPDCCCGVVDISGRTPRCDLVQKCQPRPTPTKILRCGSFAVCIQLRHSGAEVANRSSQAEPLQHLHIESKASMEYAGGDSCFARVRSSKFKRGTFTEVVERSTNTGPGRNSR